MKIVQINVTYEKASTGRTCFELYNYMKKKGINIISFTASNLKYREENQLILSKLERLYHLLFSRFIGLEGYVSYFSTKNLIRKIKIINPDIIHLRVLHGSYLNHKLLFDFIKSEKIPIVWTFHDCWAFTGKCAYYTKNNCYKWKNQSCSNCIAKKEYPESQFFDFTKKMIKDKIELYSNIEECYIVTVSNWLKEETQKSFFNQYPINSIYNWIDLEKFHPIKNYKSKTFENKNIILAVASSWSDRKGIKIFLELSKYISDNDIIILIGNYNAKLYTNTKKIQFINKTENINELVEWYNAATMFLNLSIEETFGKVSAEALACGTPVITNKYTANKEIVDDTTGIVLSDLSINQILKAIDTIKINGKLYYYENCRKRAEEKFNYESNCMQYYNLYNKIVNSSKK